jgi:hypothetical protein
VREHVTHEQATATALSGVAVAQKEMADLVAGIGRMASDTKALALNGAVKAVKIGDRGHAFEVLAEAIEDVAGQVRSNVGVIADIVTKIVGAGSTIERHEAADSSRQVLEGEAIVTDLQALLGHLHRHHDALVSGVEALSNGGDAFRSEADAVATRVFAAGATAASMQVLEDELMILFERLQALAPGDSRADDHSQDDGHGNRNGSALTSYLENAADRYTMESERLIHDAALGNSPQQRQATPQAAQGGTTELGDNVELF